MTSSKTTLNQTIGPPQTEPKAQQRHFPHLTVLLVVLIGGGLWYYGAEYYTLPLEARSDSPLHHELSPSAPVGRWLGIIGTLMMTSILLYPLRKKIRWLERAGNIRLWLRVHIFMGLMGPVLITFHTSFKMGGIVAIAYWSMIITMLSGIFGRYIYIQIPRDTSGERLSLRNLELEEERLESQLALRLEQYPILLDYARTSLPKVDTAAMKAPRTIAALLSQDLRRPVNLWGLRRVLRKQTELTGQQITEISRLLKRQAILHRRRATIDTMEKTFHHWHVLHRPFVWIMFTIVIVHIGVAILFGYAGL